MVFVLFCFVYFFFLPRHRSALTHWYPASMVSDSSAQAPFISTDFLDKVQTAGLRVCILCDGDAALQECDTMKDTYVRFSIESTQNADVICGFFSYLRLSLTQGFGSDVL